MEKGPALNSDPKVTLPPAHLGIDGLSHTAQNPQAGQIVLLHRVAPKLHESANRCRGAGQCPWLGSTKGQLCSLQNEIRGFLKTPGAAMYGPGEGRVPQVCIKASCLFASFAAGAVCCTASGLGNPLPKEISSATHWRNFEGP